MFYILLNSENIIVGKQYSSNQITSNNLIEVTEDIYSSDVLGNYWDTETQNIKVLPKTQQATVAVALTEQVASKQDIEDLKIWFLENFKNS